MLFFLFFSESFWNLLTSLGFEFSWKYCLLRILFHPQCWHAVYGPFRSGNSCPQFYKIFLAYSLFSPFLSLLFFPSLPLLPSLHFLFFLSSFLHSFQMELLIMLFCFTLLNLLVFLIKRLSPLFILFYWIFNFCYYIFIFRYFLIVLMFLFHSIWLLQDGIASSVSLRRFYFCLFFFFLFSFFSIPPFFLSFLFLSWFSLLLGLCLFPLKFLFCFSPWSSVFMWETFL